MNQIQQPLFTGADGSRQLDVFDCIDETSHRPALTIELGYTRKICAECRGDWPCPTAAQVEHDCHHCQEVFTWRPIYDPVEVHCGGTRNARTWCSTECYDATQNDLEDRL